MRILSRLTVASTVALVSSLAHANDHTRLIQLEKQAKQLQRDINTLQHHSRHSAPTSNQTDLPVTTTTSPLMGSHSAFDASDVIKQQSSINEDLTLLKNRQHYLKTLAKNGKKITRPIVELSGGLEGQVLYQDDGFGQLNSQGVGINLATAELDTQVLASNWAAGLFSIDYKNAPVSLGNRSPQSDLYLARGYVTLGDLNHCPWYFTIGKQYVPFGQYSSSLVSNGLTKSLGRISSPTASIGYYKNGFNAIGFSYSGSQTSNGSPTFKQGGVRVGYKFKYNKARYSINASWVSNIADSQGMQSNGFDNNGGTDFSGFSDGTGNNLQHAVSGGDITASGTFGSFSVYAEYLTALRHFAITDLSFNNAAAQPSAVSIEADYSFTWMQKPATFALGYDHSWQAAALNLPKQSYRASLGVSWFKNTVSSIEYRHDINYSSTEINNSGGAGKGIPASTGDTRNSVILQLGVYF